MADHYSYTIQDSRTKERTTISLSFDDAEDLAWKIKNDVDPYGTWES